MKFQQPSPGPFLHKIVLLIAVSFTSLQVTIAQTNIAVASNKLNVLYIGVDNPLSIAASNGSDEQVTVSIKGGGGFQK
jgi:GldM C-terminal domain